MEKLHHFDEVFDSQKMFRILLEATANPTRQINIHAFAEKLFGSYPQLLAIAMTLLDNEVTFNTCENQTLAEEITLLTHATAANMDQADYIFVSEKEHLKNAIETAKCGTLPNPHLGATIIVQLSDEEYESIELFGAGIQASITLKMQKTAVEGIHIRDAQAYEYPCGIDLIFVSKNGELFCIPRLTLKK